MRNEPVSLCSQRFSPDQGGSPIACAWPLIIGMLGTSVGVVFASQATGLIDDDAYIFLRYAEHLANGHGLAFNPGEPSAGVTSILWVVLLALARRLTGADMLTIAQTLGAIGFGAGLAVMVGGLTASPQQRAAARTAGVIVACSPVFICQAISGMEVGLNMLLVALALANPSALAAGLAFVTRPDNVLLAPFVVALKPNNRLRAAVITSLCLLAPIIPWAAYCYHVGGSLLPPTRMGKLLVFLPGWYGVTASEFHALSAVARLALTARGLARVARMFTEGQARALLIWLPLLPFGLARVRRTARATVLLFALSAATYAVFFPLIKLRYFVHLLPWLVGIGLVGLTRLTPPRLHRALFTALIMGHVALCARALPRYRAWVACEGTKTLVGEWVATHTAPEARLALEPIGAIGYHSRRYVIDLGGLISSDVWGVIRNGPAVDPDELLTYLRARRADFLIDEVDGPWVRRVRSVRPESLRLEATIPGRADCGVIGIYAVAR